MAASKYPVYKGDPATCVYCIEQLYPHSHGEGEPDDPPVRKKQARRKAAVVAAVTATGLPKHRGRPWSAENAELLRVCTCE